MEMEFQSPLVKRKMSGDGREMLDYSVKTPRLIDASDSSGHGDLSFISPPVAMSSESCQRHRPFTPRVKQHLKLKLNDDSISSFKLGSPDDSSSLLLSPDVTLNGFPLHAVSPSFDSQMHSPQVVLQLPEPRDSKYSAKSSKDRSLGVDEGSACKLSPVERELARFRHEHGQNSPSSPDEWGLPRTPAPAKVLFGSSDKDRSHLVGSEKGLKAEESAKLNISLDQLLHDHHQRSFTTPSALRPIRGLAAHRGAHGEVTEPSAILDESLFSPISGSLSMSMESLVVGDRGREQVKRKMDLEDIDEGEPSAVDPKLLRNRKSTRKVSYVAKMRLRGESPVKACELPFSP